MKSKNAKIIIFLLLLNILSICLSGCNMQKNDNSNMNEKINSEVSYLDSELISIANELNSISYTKYKVDTKMITNNSSNEGSSKSEGKESQSNSGQSSESENSKEGNESKQKQNKQEESYEMASNNILNNKQEINWDRIANKIENLYTSWTTIANDLKEIGLAQEQIDNFSTLMDTMTINIKNRDKNATLESVINLYEYLPKFEEKNQNTQLKYILDCKYSLLRCYQLADLEQWEQFNNSTIALKMNISNIISQKDKYENKYSSIQNASTIINEIGNEKNTKNREVFFIKYKNLMQELDSIKVK